MIKEGCDRSERRVSESMPVVTLGLHHLTGAIGGHRRLCMRPRATAMGTARIELLRRHCWIRDALADKKLTLCPHGGDHRDLGESSPRS